MDLKNLKPVPGALLALHEMLSVGLDVRIVFQAATLDDVNLLSAKMNWLCEQIGSRKILSL